MIDDKRLTMTHEDADTFFVSVISLKEHSFLVMHDSTCGVSTNFFKLITPRLSLQELDNHDKIDGGFLNLGVSIGQFVPIGLLFNPSKFGTDSKISGIKNQEDVTIVLSNDNRVLGITKYNIPNAEIPKLVDSINQRMGFEAISKAFNHREEFSNLDYYIEKNYTWNRIGAFIQLELIFFLDSENNRYLNKVGKKQWRLSIQDNFLIQCEKFKSSFLD